MGSSGTYIGYVNQLTGLPHGQGKFTLSCGNSHEGIWNHGYLDGSGTLRNHHTHFVGTFFRMGYKVHGTYNYGQGISYTGTF